VLVPANFDPSPEFAEARTIGAVLKSALEAARPDRVVYLSTIGAQAKRSNLLTQHTIIERALELLSMPITFLRPPWFMENCRWNVAAARENGAISSILQPLDKPFPMVATADIGRVAAELLQVMQNGPRVVELEGPHRVTPHGIADAFADDPFGGVVGHSDGIAVFRKGSPICRNLHLRNFVILEKTNRPYQYD
jgi:uncharacterized protein YbjT (DUF2867 family)